MMGEIGHGQEGTLAFSWEQRRESVQLQVIWWVWEQQMMG